MTATIIAWALLGLLLGVADCCQGRESLRLAEKCAVGIIGTFLGGLVGWGLGISLSKSSMAGMQPTALVLLAVIAALIFSARSSRPASGPTR